MIEIIDLDYRFSTKSLLNFSKDNNIDNSSNYEWQNHWVIYCDMKDAENLKTKLESCYPRLIIKVYNEPFYNFKLQSSNAKRTMEQFSIEHLSDIFGKHNSHLYAKLEQKLRNAIDRIK